MKFQKGHKLAKGGKRLGAGRPTQEQLEFKEALKQAVEKEARRKVDAIAKRYVTRATSKNGDKVLMHLIDKAISAARTDLNITGQIKMVEIIAPDPEKER